MYAARPTAVRGHVLAGRARSERKSLEAGERRRRRGRVLVEALPQRRRDAFGTGDQLREEVAGVALLARPRADLPGEQADLSVRRDVAVVGGPGQGRAVVVDRRRNAGEPRVDVGPVLLGRRRHQVEHAADRVQLAGDDADLRLWSCPRRTARGRRDWRSTNASLAACSRSSVGSTSCMAASERAARSRRAAKPSGERSVSSSRGQGCRSRSRRAGRARRSPSTKASAISSTGRVSGSVTRPNLVAGRSRLHDLCAESNVGAQT